MSEANIWQPRTVVEIRDDTQSIVESHTGVLNQTLISLRNFTYTLGVGAVQVFKDGHHLRPNEEWTEVTDASISLVTPLVGGEKITVRGDVGITGTVDVRDTDIYLANYPVLRVYAGTETTVYLQGRATLADGGEDFFEYKTGAAPGFYVDDNNSVIVPTAGDGSAAWLRSDFTDFTTSAALKLSYPKVGHTYTTSIYAVAGDGGAANYLCKTAAQAATDGDVIDGFGNFTAASGDVLILQHNGAPNLLQYGVRNVTSFDSTAAFQAAVANNATLTLYKNGTYKVTDEVELLGNACIVLSAGVTIQQFTADKRIFFANNKDNVWIALNGAVLYGEGTWSAGWTGNSGHADRGIELINCTRSGIIKPNVKNMASGGISIIGGDRLFIDSPLIEGTHTYSTVLPASSNFQNGLYLKHDSIEGNITNLSIASPMISGVAQGILVEGYGGLVQTDDMIINILNPIIHDIPGQHGIYCQVGKVNIPSANIDDCELDGIKIQDNGTVNPADVNIPDFNISNCGSHAIEIQAAAAGGSVSFVKANGIARDCSRGLGINGVTATSTVKHIDIDMMCYNSGAYGAIIQGHASAPISDIDLKITSDISGQYGVYVTAAQATGIRITPKVRKAGGDAADTYDGILIEAATDIDIIHPDVTDSLGNQRYAFYTSSTTALVKVFHKAIFQDGTTYDVRADVDMEYWPSDVTLSAGTTESRMQDLKRFSKTTDHVIATNQSTSATDVTLWQSEMPDESAWFLTASVVAKLSDSTDRESWIRTALCYRDAGGNVVIDAQGDIQNLGASGAALIWELSGTTIRLRGNSGGAVTYDWKARVSYEDVS